VDGLSLLSQNVKTGILTQHHDDDSNDHIEEEKICREVNATCVVLIEMSSGKEEEPACSICQTKGNISRKMAKEK
jgi:hypothetical protein